MPSDFGFQRLRQLPCLGLALTYVEVRFRLSRKHLNENAPRPDIERHCRSYPGQDEWRENAVVFRYLVDGPGVSRPSLISFSQDFSNGILLTTSARPPEHCRDFIPEQCGDRHFRPVSRFP